MLREVTSLKYVQAFGDSVLAFSDINSRWLLTPVLTSSHVCWRPCEMAFIRELPSFSGSLSSTAKNSFSGLGKITSKITSVFLISFKLQVDFKSFYTRNKAMVIFEIFNRDSQDERTINIEIQIWHLAKLRLFQVFLRQYFCCFWSGIWRLLNRF